MSPGTDGLSAEAILHGALLPAWKSGIGRDVLHVRGLAKNISPGQETAAAVKVLQDRGWFDQAFSDALMAHQGRVTRGLYNVIRNEAVMRHGVDMRTLEAQRTAGEARRPGLALAAE